jgi:hypothetical protein
VPFAGIVRENWKKTKSKTRKKMNKFGMEETTG